MKWSRLRCKPPDPLRREVTHGSRPNWVIFDRSGQSWLPVHVCFALKADLSWPPLVWSCFVRDITSLGARFEFQDAPLLTVFNLTFDGKTLRRCHLKWRIANEVGVSFQRPRKT
jgi:hypothetical protein